MNLISPRHKVGNAIELFTSFQDPKSKAKRGTYWWDTASCLTQYYGDDLLENYIYEARDYYYPKLFKGVPTGTIISSVKDALDTEQKSGRIKGRASWKVEHTLSKNVCSKYKCSFSCTINRLLKGNLDPFDIEYDVD